MESPQQVAMRHAASQLGYNEQAQNAALRDYLSTGGANLDPQETAWCAAFVNASLGHAGIEGTGSNMARSFLDWGQPVEAPQPGDVAVFSRGDPNGPYGHVGFYAGQGDDGIKVLGGNQSDSVSYANYPEERLLGYRRAIDPRMASTTGGGPAVSPYTLPDKWGLPQLPDQSPDTQMMDYSQPHPALQAILAQQQPRKPSNNDLLLALGSGILNSRGPNWFGSGLNSVQQVLQRQPEKLGAMEYLQANASLWQLEQKNMERQQAKQEQQRQREYLQGIAENESLPPQVRFQAQNQLMGIEGLELPEPPKPPEMPSKIREAEALAARLGIPIEEAYARVGLGAEGEEAARWFGGGQPVTFQDGRQGVAITNDQGELEIRMLPEGAELRGTPGFESAVAGGRATAENIANRYDKLVAETSTGLANVNSGLSNVTRLIEQIDEGRYRNTGLFRGAINTALGDVDNALLQLQTVNAQLQGLQITNLAPVTEKELELMSRLYANVDRTPAQNRAILAELKRSYASKKRVLEQVNKQIREGKPVYEIMMDLPALYEPDTTVGGGEQSEADIEQEMMDLANEQRRDR